MRDLELNRLDMFFRLISRKNIESLEVYDTSLMVGSPSFKYYESKIVLSFHRLLDYNEQLYRRVLEYLRSVNDILKTQKDRKGYLMRKNLVILSRKERDYNLKILQ